NTLSDMEKSSSRKFDLDDCFDQDSEGSAAIRGTCLLMCPAKERERRERLRDLSIFERFNGNPAKSSPNLAVKKFCRTISKKGLEASDVRPIPVLERTLSYIISFLHSTDHPFEIIHDFIFDRMRSIRQDLSLQNAFGNQVIHIYERMVKVHIISSRRLRESPGNLYAVSMVQLNQEQLFKSLLTLLNLYDAASRASNEFEFYSYHLLLHLGSNHQEPLSLWFRRVPTRILKSREMCFARRLLRYYRLGNYRGFVQTVEEEASFLQYCIIEPYINEMRKLALSCICYGGYKLQPYPLLQLSKLLMMQEDDVECLCIDRGFDLSLDGSEKGLPSKSKQVQKKETSEIVTKYYPLRSERIVR
ncbi:hypothetical protein M569_06578, partial [Genlisea aurea]